MIRNLMMVADNVVNVEDFHFCCHPSCARFMHWDMLISSSLLNELDELELQKLAASHPAMGDEWKMCKC